MADSRDDGSAREGPGRRRRRKKPSEAEDGGKLPATEETLSPEEVIAPELGAIEEGGPLQLDRGRVKIVYEKFDLDIEGPTPIIIMATGVLGCLGGGYLATQANGLVPGLVVILAVLGLVGFYLHGHRG